MEHSPSWEANWFAASQEIPHILWNPMTDYRSHKFLPPFPILNQLEPVHNSTSHFLKIHLSIILPSTSGPPKWSLCLRFPHQSPVYTPRIPQTCYMPRPPHSSRFDHPNNIWWGVQRWWADCCNYSVNPLRALCACVMNRNRLLVSSRTNGFPSLAPFPQETSVEHLGL